MNTIVDILDYIFYAMVVTIAVFGNSLVIVSIVKFEFLRSNANYFVGSLACGDLLMALSWVIMQGMNEWKRHLTIDGYSSWEIACHAAINFQTFAILGDFLSIFAITVDRFIYINFPFRYELWVTRTRVYAILVLIYITAVPFSAFFSWYTDRINYGKACTLFFVMEPLLMSVLWTPMLAFVIVVFLAVYTKVAYLAYKAKREIQSQQVSSTTSQGTRSKNTGKSTRSFLLVIGVFLSTYTIWLIVYYITLDKYSDTVELIQKVTEWFWQTNIWINPLIYAYKNKDFKRAFRKLLKLRPNDSDINSSHHGAH